MTRKYIRKLEVKKYDITHPFFIGTELHVSADMFESVNKETPIHPLYKVGFLIVKGLPEEARLNSDG